MKSKYKIIDLSNNPHDLQPGDMVKLRKGLIVGKRYGIILLRCMRFRWYKTVAQWWYKSDTYNSIRLTNDFIYTIQMLDLTCVKRRIEQ